MGKSLVKGKSPVLFLAFALVLSAATGVDASGAAGATSFAQDGGGHEGHTMPATVQRRRRVRGDRRRHRGIGHAYGRAGRSAARGASRLARYTAQGRPVRGGKHFGKGMGGFGKHAGKGTARVGKKIGRGFKRAVTP